MLQWVIYGGQGIINIKIYIGLTTKGGEVIDNDKVIADILEIVLFEGFTMYQAKSVYKKETRGYYYNWNLRRWINRCIQQLIDKSFALAKKLREHFNQECVMLIVDDKTYFV